ncbi:MAG: DoxX family protein [Chitinophagales bacterium]
MITALWVMKGILTFVFLLAGFSKMFQTKEKVIATAGKWAEDFTETQIRLIGFAEAVLAVLLVVPKLLGHGYFLTSAAAFGLVIIMAGAAYTHFRRNEFPLLIINIVFLLMALFIAFLTCPLMQHWDYV